MTSSRPVRLTLLLAVAVLVVLNFLFARLHFLHETRALPGAMFREVELPSANIVQTVLLNYSSFGADLAWIAVNVNLGAARMQHRRLLRLDTNANIVRGLDPRFFRIYEWFPAVWIASRAQPSMEHVDTATEFVEAGMREYPLDTSLPFSAAMSYVGLKDKDDEARIRRYRRIVELLKKAATGSNVHPDNPFVLAYHQRRLKSLERGEAPSVEEEMKFYSYLYIRTVEPEARRKLAARLRELGAPDDAMKNALLADAEFERMRQQTLPFAPPVLFVFVSDAL